MKTIVLGLGVNGLAVVRSLGEQGLTVSGIYMDEIEDLGRHSKYLSVIKKLPKDYSVDELFESCLSFTKVADDTRSNHKPVIFCSSDSFASIISKNQDLFEQHFLITTPNKDMYWRFLAKKSTADICTENNVPIPKTVYCNEPHQFIERIKSLTFPLIIKPDLTFDGKFPGKNLIVHSLVEAESFISGYPELETEVIAQEIVPSGDGKIYLVTTFSDKSGKVRIAYSGKKIRQYLPDFGVTCFGVSEDIPKLKQTVINFLENINYTGYATLEFAYDKANDEYIFIELNIRSFYHNQLFKDAGLDINYIAYQVTTNENYSLDCLIKQKDRVYWLDFTRDFGSFLRKKHLTTWSWLKSLSKARSFAYFDKKDIKPFIVSIKVFIIITMKTLFNK